MVFVFESRLGDASSHNDAKLSDQNSKNGGLGKQDSHLPPSTFLAKYSHPMAKSLRNQVEKLLKLVPSSVQ